MSKNDRNNALFRDANKVDNIQSLINYLNGYQAGEVPISNVFNAIIYYIFNNYIDVEDEVFNTITGLGIPLDHNNPHQLLQAIDKEIDKKTTYLYNATNSLLKALTNGAVDLAKYGNISNSGIANINTYNRPMLGDIKYSLNDSNEMMSGWICARHNLNKWFRCEDGNVRQITTDLINNYVKDEGKAIGSKYGNNSITISKANLPAIEWTDGNVPYIWTALKMKPHHHSMGVHTHTVSGKILLPLNDGKVGGGYYAPSSPPSGYTTHGSYYANINLDTSSSGGGNTGDYNFNYQWFDKDNNKKRVGDMPIYFKESVYHINDPDWFNNDVSRSGVKVKLPGNNQAISIDPIHTAARLWLYIGINENLQSNQSNVPSLDELKNRMINPATVTGTPSTRTMTKRSRSIANDNYTREGNVFIINSAKTTFSIPISINDIQASDISYILNGNTVRQDIDYKLSDGIIKFIILDQSIDLRNIIIRGRITIR